MSKFKDRKEYIDWKLRTREIGSDADTKNQQSGVHQPDVKNSNPHAIIYFLGAIIVLFGSGMLFFAYKSYKLQYQIADGSLLAQQTQEQSHEMSPEQSAPPVREEPEQLNQEKSPAPTPTESIQVQLARMEKEAREDYNRRREQSGPTPEQYNESPAQQDTSGDLGSALSAVEEIRAAEVESEATRKMKENARLRDYFHKLNEIRSKTSAEFLICESICDGYARIWRQAISAGGNFDVELEKYREEMNWWHNTFEKLKESKEEIDKMTQKVANPPDSHRSAHAKILELYGVYSRIYSFAMNPTGSYVNFTRIKSDIRDEYNRLENEMKLIFDTEQ